jgi:hypothetical protein
MPSRVRARGLSRRHTSTTRNLAAGAIGAALLGAEMLGAGPAAAAGSDAMAALRQCESGGNYSTNTGNGFYGAYQFALGTWQGLGYSGLPSSASPAIQDQAAMRLQAQQGWAPWPACSRRLGLYGRISSPVVHHQYRSVTVAPAASTAYRGQLFTTALVNSVRPDVRAWQLRMVQLGYPITVDGQYGPQSAGACVAFERARGLDVDSGIVGPQVWTAAFGR